ncbi:enoyl-CoA hydratase/isomerase family protein [Paraburkholderia sp. CNPSo 3281]|uniref:enoyl-CoA hydratase/isomerase family protein n=1 Tax=Paraburkholderia sp. CNPSo 3281 TaxID=2940933 RepID=UPI0020B734F4|nr:enoyl-CoA hydratase-related protein [Paraburkholderia sp. CNPSo 3281]MCP3720435.1 enoyl-CoA hydratase-related protein [Paraburkholderia sp. CNPSo 3281]
MSEKNTAVLVHRTGAIVEIVLNRPQVLNAANVQLATDFLSVCQGIAGDPGVRSVIVRGEGKAFMAGGDLAEFTRDLDHAAEVADSLIKPLNEAVTILSQMSAPVIGSVHGAVAGAGVSLALACDLVIAADNTKFNMAYSKIGASPDVSGSWSLPRVVGLHKAMEIALLSETFDAQEAHRLGLVYRVVSNAELARETMSLACRLANGPTRSFGVIKQLFRDSLDRNLNSQLEAERLGFRECATTSDFKEGVAAFQQRRTPLFTGS